jgi:hypothetical protein
MKNHIKTTYRSIHIDYLRFAVMSYRDCKNESNRSSASAFISKNVIESVRYSYDCLDALVKFVFFLGDNDSLPIIIDDTWLLRYIRRQWNTLSLSDSIGILTYAFTSESFWQNEEQFQLFEDLRKLRNGLTHPKPLGKKVFQDEQSIRTEELLEPNYLVHSKPIANFHSSPDLLDHTDAEKAFEILLHHLIRIQNLFFQNSWPTQFAYYDEIDKKVLSTKQLLQSIHCRYLKYWQD